MAGGARLLTLALHSFTALLVLSLAWPLLALPYDRLLVTITSALSPDSTTLSASGANILVRYARGDQSTELILKGLALHWGVLLAVALVMVTPAAGWRYRVLWAVLFFAVFLAIHIVGLYLFTLGYTYAVRGQGNLSVGTIMGLFSVGWALIPPIVIGIWCYCRWLPALRAG